MLAGADQQQIGFLPEFFTLTFVRNAGREARGSVATACAQPLLSTRGVQVGRHCAATPNCAVGQRLLAMSYGGRKKHTQALLMSMQEKIKNEAAGGETVRTDRFALATASCSVHCTGPAATAWKLVAGHAAVDLLTAAVAPLDVATGSDSADGGDERVEEEDERD
eukprot:COSAG02_NODE_1619_length_11636_cov_26.969836_6_plen_165_part_00